MLGLGQLSESESVALASPGLGGGLCLPGYDCGLASRAVSKAGPWDWNWDRGQATGGQEAGQVTKTGLLWSQVRDAVHLRAWPGMSPLPRLLALWLWSGHDLRTKQCVLTAAAGWHSESGWTPEDRCGCPTVSVSPKGDEANPPGCHKLLWSEDPRE